MADLPRMTRAFGPSEKERPVWKDWGRKTEERPIWALDRTTESDEASQGLNPSIRWGWVTKNTNRRLGIKRFSRSLLSRAIHSVDKEGAKWSRGKSKTTLPSAMSCRAKNLSRDGWDLMAGKSDLFSLLLQMAHRVW
jgi:hypothetical protein